MSGAITYFAFVLISCLLIFTGVDYSNSVIVSNNIYDTVRSTQSTTLHDSIQIGNLIVNDELTISKDKVESLWLENFDKNNTTNYVYDIEIKDINQQPAGIAVNVKVYEDYSMLDTDLQYEYQNIIIVDDGKE